MSIPGNHLEDKLVRAVYHLQCEGYDDEARAVEELQRKLDTAYEIIDKEDDLGATIRNVIEGIAKYRSSGPHQGKINQFARDLAEYAIPVLGDVNGVIRHYKIEIPVSVMKSLKKALETVDAS
jgi:hypothetical protein